METDLKSLQTNSNDTLRFSLYNDPGVDFDPIHWNFIPVEYERFITICIDNEYKYWHDVIELAAPILFKEKIGIITFSIQESAQYKKCLNINKIKIRNAVYLLKKSLGHFCGQDWSLTIAQNNGYDFFFVKTGEKKYLFKNTDNYTEDLERPEIIVRKIFDTLGLKQEIFVNTQIIGPSYTAKVLEMIPDFDISGSPNVDEGTLIGVRCDLYENWDFVFNCLKLGVAPIVTCKSLPEKSILGFLTNVPLINILIDEDFDISKIEVARSIGIQIQLICKVEDPERLKKIKRKFFDFGNILFIKNWGKENLDKLSKLDYSTKIRSKRLLFGKNGTFLSVFHWRRNYPISTLNGDRLSDALEDEEFLTEADLFYYYN